ncbi:hypothetical protein H9Q10_06400 [Eikenella sp. S3360]|uniref:Lipoprotein n=1 Tax=Eikenella glucosivorans TaxID=2766967 RepID=A0ABS0NAH4_9NEIS|nr:hypothetical protein [Eikenella glucosivorans]MBH5329299.1 hypothetical protein [Eikenella glucosivorans]
MNKMACLAIGMACGLLLGACGGQAAVSASAPAVAASAVSAPAASAEAQAAYPGGFLLDIAGSGMRVGVPAHFEFENRMTEAGAFLPGVPAASIGLLQYDRRAGLLLYAVNAAQAQSDGQALAAAGRNEEGGRLEGRCMRPDVEAIRRSLQVCNTDNVCTGGEHFRPDGDYWVCAAGGDAAAREGLLGGLSFRD